MAGLSDQRLFHATLYERHDLRRAKSGPPDKKRPPTHSDGLRVVKPMLPDIPDTDRLDVEWEADTVAKALAGQGPFSQHPPLPPRMAKIHQGRSVHPRLLRRSSLHP